MFARTLVKFIWDKYKVNERRYYNGFNSNLFILDEAVLLLWLSVQSTLKFKTNVVKYNKSKGANRELMRSIYDFMRHICKTQNLIISDSDKIYNLIELAFKHELRVFLNEVTDYSVEFIKDLFAEKKDNYNILNRCVFVVEDLVRHRRDAQ